MVIYGVALEQKGKEYYMVKNSWGETGQYKGICDASKTFAKYKTMNNLIHKDAFPADIPNKFGL